MPWPDLTSLDDGPLVKCIMMASTSGPTHRSIANIRPQPGTNTGSPASPHTPLRAISSTYGSPSALRAEEDCVIIELGSRHLRAGFAGDATPRAVLNFSPEEQRRPGDTRRWTPDYEKNWRGRTQGNWGEAHELWRTDLRGLDLGLVGDKIERAIREAFTKSVVLSLEYSLLNCWIEFFLSTPGQEGWL